MLAGLRDSYVDVIFYMGVNEIYPFWFTEILYSCILVDEDRYTFYIPREERGYDYYEKKLVEDYSVFLRKADGSIHVTDYDTFEELYNLFKYDKFENSGLASLKSDCIEYIVCHGGQILSGYPEWFYEYFTEALHNPNAEESVFISEKNGDVTITEHCVFLRNRFGEIRVMAWKDFTEYYDPDPDN